MQFLDLHEFLKMYPPPAGLFVQNKPKRASSQYSRT